MSDTVCVIPGLEYHELGRRVLGQRKVSVAVYDADEAQNLISMPPCPVKLVVETLSSTPADVVTLLREGFPHVQCPPRIIVAEAHGHWNAWLDDRPMATFGVDTPGTSVERPWEAKFSNRLLKERASKIPKICNVDDHLRASLLKLLQTAIANLVSCKHHGLQLGQRLEHVTCFVRQTTFDCYNKLKLFHSIQVLKALI